MSLLASHKCRCDLRNRKWNPNTRLCEFCGGEFKDDRVKRELQTKRKGINTMSEEVDENHTQVMPVVNDMSAIQDLVMRDLLERKIMGIKKYGVPLQPFNTRSAKLDKYEELLDAAIYARQELEEEIELERKTNLKYGDLIAGIQSGKLVATGDRSGMRDATGKLIE